MEDSLFPIVGIGASAGGIEALQEFFRPMPVDCGMAFVIVTHLSPDRHSLLDKVVGRFTKMPVKVAVDGMEVERDTVYVLGEMSVIGIENGRLRVDKQDVDNRERKPIDLFFSALAMERADFAAGVMLSGGDGDGTLGIKAIKERGGLTMAQVADGTSPRHSSMPQSAIATGLVDFSVPVETMAAQLLAFAQSFELLNRMAKADEDGGDAGLREAQKAIYATLRNQIGHDFSGYKKRTFNRRVYRRMQVLQMETIEAYVDRLEQDAAETTALFRDLLINVTSFFRDVDAFRALEQIALPKLFEGRGAEDTVRVWIPGCATGEEVYSIAILMREHMLSLRAVPRVQIFATDIDERSLSIARAARYPAPLVGNVAPERLARYFTKDGGHFIVTKDVRDICIFSAHSVIKDPPFSRMDMVSCRNLLIYFGQQIQAQVIPTFHYSLKPNGFLFLGTSENISQFGDLFVAVDKRHRIFRAREDSRSAMRLPFAIDSLQPLLKTEGRGTRTPSSVSLRQAVDDCVMDRFAPPHVVVNGDGDVVHYSSRTGKYLEAAPGMPSRQVLSMARIGLRLDLRAALREAADKRVIVTRERIPIEADSDRVQFVSLTVAPMPERGDGTLFIILFTDDGPTLSRDQAMVRGRGDADESLVHLEHDLREARERLQSMIEQYETALEELKSSNEELVSVNEELQSTNEELEASKEELQSLNEELQTVNIELTSKVDALDRSNSDLRNLFDSTQVATIFLDQALAIRNFTPSVARLFNIRRSDRGRPLADLASRMDYPDLHDDIRRALDTGDAIERRVAVDNEMFLARLRPYLNSDGRIDGVVATFFDVTSIAVPQDELGGEREDPRLT
jgi:two-component system CheB/CheR fusion protein